MQMCACDSVDTEYRYREQSVSVRVRCAASESDAGIRTVAAADGSWQACRAGHTAPISASLSRTGMTWLSASSALTRTPVLPASAMRLCAPRCERASGQRRRYEMAGSAPWRQSCQYNWVLSASDVPQNSAIRLHLLTLCWAMVQALQAALQLAIQSGAAGGP